MQFIGADGDMRFLTGGRVVGCYFSIGTMQGAAALCIVEGFTTGATINEATGYPVVVAFNAGNLEPVAKAMRAKFPELPLILCADDDSQTEDNLGLAKAARAVGGLLAGPEFREGGSMNLTDFNDMATLCGREAVRRAIANASEPPTGESQHSEENAPAGDSETALERRSGGTLYPDDPATFRPHDRRTANGDPVMAGTDRGDRPNDDCRSDRPVPAGRRCAGLLQRTGGGGIAEA